MEHDGVEMGSGQAEHKPPTKTIFEAVLKAWREHFKKPLNQDEFYTRCKQQEKLQGNPRLGFSSSSTTPRKELARLLSDEEQLPVHAKQVFAAVLLLDESFFLNVHESVDAAVAIAQAHWQQRNAPGDATGAQGEYPPQQPAIPMQADTNLAEDAHLLPWRGFGPIDLNRVLPPSRVKNLEELRAASDASRQGNRVLVSIEAGTGAGKTYLFSRWFWEDLAKDFLPAIVLDCSRKSFDQALTDARTEFASEVIAQFPTQRRLLVFDNLRLERLNGQVLLVAAGFNRPIPVTRAVAEINRLFEDIRRLCVVLSIENNGRLLDQQTVRTVLDPSAQYKPVQIKWFTTTEGADFLRERGVEWASRSDLEKVAEALHGMPAALEVAADMLIDAAEQEREAYLGNLLTMRLHGGNLFADFLQEWLSRRDIIHEEMMRRGELPAHAASPRAALRLLALMDGPISEMEIRHLLDQIKIRRLGDAALALKELNSSPFVRRTGMLYDLHPMARLHLRQELNRFIERDRFDSHTSRAELEHIHWRAAIMSRHVLRHEQHADLHTIATLDSYVHHMLEQIRLIPPGKEWDHRRRTKSIAGIGETEFEKFELAPGRLSDSKLWELAYREVRRLILDNRNVATRVFGRFEDKARILRRLADAAREAKFSLSPGYAELTKEMAVCLMHAGKLRLAIHALSLPMNFSSAPDGAEDDTRLIRESNRACIEAAIRLRSGEIVDTVDAVLQPYLPQARELANLAPENFRATRDDILPEERVALRVLARAADLALQAGDLDGAGTLFGLALRLHRARRVSEIDGECARRYAVYLMRRAPGDKAAIEEARAIIHVNLAHYASRRLVDVRKGSNDIVPFTILDAAIQRVAGDLSAARQTLADLRQDPFVRNGQCTYVALVELEIEAIRQDMWALPEGAGDPLDKDLIRHRLEELLKRLLQSHHLTLSYEVRLLLAEMLPHDAAQAESRMVRAMLTHTGLRLRLADCKLVEGGESALRHYGL